MTPTVAFTSAQKLAAAPLVGGRPSVALKELKRRLRTELPALLDYVNDELGLTGLEKYEKPRDYIFAPVPVEDNFIGNVLIGHQVRSQVRGMAGGRVMLMDVSIWIPERRVAAESQWLDQSDRAVLLAMCLEQYHNGCVDLDGRKVWTTLEPQETFLSVLPESWRDYSGFSLNYLMAMGAADSAWSTK